MSSKVERKGPGLKKVLNNIKKPGTVDVGIIDAGEHPSGDATVAEIGFYNEFGTTRIPERSFLRSTLHDKKKEIVTLQKKLLKKITKGEITVPKALGLVGLKVADLIQQKIVSISSPANASQTVARKGSSNPLIDTSQLKNSITFKVNE